MTSRGVDEYIRLWNAGFSPAVGGTKGTTDSSSGNPIKSATTKGKKP